MYQMTQKGGDANAQGHLMPIHRRPAATHEGELLDAARRAPAPVALAAVATWVPEQVITIEDLSDYLGLTLAQTKVLTRVHGLREVRMSPGRMLTDSLHEVAARALQAVSDRKRVRYVIHAHTLQDVAPSTVNVVHEVCRRLGLDQASAFSITQQNCASGLLSVDVAAALLDGEPDGLALLLLGEKPFTPLAQLIPGTTVMGEAAAACLLAPGGTRDRMLSYCSRTHGQYSAGLKLWLKLDADRRAAFERGYTDTLAEVILGAVHDAGLTLDDVALILPHNVNRSSWLRVARTLGLDRERLLLDNVARLGHCFCADPFLTSSPPSGRGGWPPATTT